MKIKAFILPLIIITAVAIAVSCRNATPTHRANKAVIPAADGTVRLTLHEGRAESTIRKQERKDIYVDFSINAPGQLHADIAPVGTPEGNLRISTITLPDGTTDGPFGQRLDYDIPSPGTVRLRIGESLMQGDPWGGDFTLKIQVVAP